MNRLQLRAWRLERYLSQTQLGELLGVDKQTVYRWEAGEREYPEFLELALAGLDTRHYWSREGIDALPRIGKRARA